jgi:hypothetical protein
MEIVRALMRCRIAMVGTMIALLVAMNVRIGTMAAHSGISRVHPSAEIRTHRLRLKWNIRRTFRTPAEMRTGEKMMGIRCQHEFRGRRTVMIASRATAGRITK